ncbi:helix-turn-helix domain-containing protein [Streptomyces caniscabiei]|uniref:helix-turn-helix domain-containing protein n=1 Tax=Streptomyces caniscabiei TaxID=2746961 RepID=UPI0038F6AB96
MFFEQHPLDLDIVAFFDQRNEDESGSVGNHIHSCKICTARLHQVAPNSFNQSEGDTVAVKSLASAAQDSNSSHSLVSLVNSGRVVDPQPGQLWRLHWEDVTHLALIASTAHGNLTFWPVTLDIQLADESSLLVPASESGGIDLELAIWPALETGIGTYVLECYITDILTPERLRQLRRAYRTGDELPVQWLPGPATAGPESPRGVFRTDLIQVAGFLSEAGWEPDDWAESSFSALPSFSELLSAAGIKATQLAEELGIPSRRAISLCRGLSEPTPQELDRVHNAFGLSTSGQTGAPPRNVIEALDDPHARNLILRAAAAEGKDEVSLRRDVARSHFALAARKTGISENAAFEMLATELRKRIAASQGSNS